jgi:dynein heavy chain 1
MAVAKKRRVRWDTRELSEWVTKLANLVTKLEERVEQLLQTCDKVDVALKAMKIVEYDASKFQGVIESIQKAIDEMSLSGYSDLASWVKVLDDRLANVLAKRLTMALESWNYTCSP